MLFNCLVRGGNPAGKAEGSLVGRDERLEDLRDHIFKNLGLGQQSQGGKGLDAFIKELEKINLR
jgi:hypothetical protein